MILQKYEEDHAVVDPFLADAPRTENPRAVTGQIGGGLYFRNDNHDELVGGFLFKPRQSLIQFGSKRRAGCLRVIVKSAGWVKLESPPPIRARVKGSS